jgi:uridine kinase
MVVSCKKFLKKIQEYIKPEEKPFIIGVAGGSGSGKTFISEKIAQKFRTKILSIDDYIIGEKIKQQDNWDLPEIWNLELLQKHLSQLKKGKIIQKPSYNFSKHQTQNLIPFPPQEIIILEGLHSLNPVLLPFLNFKIFIDSAESVRLNRRISRDTKERGRTKSQIIKKWNSTVQPTYLTHILPQKNNANLTILNN